MFCNKCGSPLSTTAKFCPGCGAQIVGASSPPPRYETTQNQSDTFRQAGDLDFQPQQQNPTYHSDSVEPQLNIPPEQSINPTIYHNPSEHRNSAPIYPIRPQVQKNPPFNQTGIGESYIPPAMPMPTKPRPQKNSLSGGKIALSLLCSVLIFISTLSGLAIFTARSAISPDNISALIDNIDIQDIMEELDAEEWLGQISPEAAEKISELPAVREYLNELVIDYVDSILTNTQPKGIDSEKAIAIMKQEEDELEELLGMEFTLATYNSAYAFIKFDLEGEDIIPAEIKNSTGLKVAQTFLSPMAGIIPLAIAAFFILLLFIIQRVFATSLKWTGTTLIITSLFFLSFLIIKSILVGLLDNIEPLIANFVETVVDGLVGSISLYGIVVLASGITALIVGTVLGKNHINSHTKTY